MAFTMMISMYLEILYFEFLDLFNLKLANSLSIVNLILNYSKRPMFQNFDIFKY